MGINFPNAPAVGELHPTPPQAGVPQYRWDGVAWVAQSQDQLAFVKRTGDTMSGALTLPADPAAALQAATKQYVDAKSSLYISDNPPVGPPDGSMWWDSDNGLLYIRYNDGAGPSQWVQAVATPAIDSSVFVNKAGDTMGGALTLPGDPAAALQAAPKQYVDAVRAYAAPYDAIAYSGMQVNGSMEVSQENALGANIVMSAGSKYIVDGWGFITTGAQILTGVPGNNSVPGFPRSIWAFVTTANAAPAAGHFCGFYTPIEGTRISRLAWGTANASPVTISFWIYVARAGTYSGSLNSGTRSYPFNLPLVAGWQYKSITIPGDTTGTWKTDNTAAVYVYISMMAGSTMTGPAGAWTAGNLVGANGTINGVASTSDQAMLTGFTMIPGTQAPTAAQSPTIMRPYDQELVTCKRYWQWIAYNMYFTASGAGAVNGDSISFSQMRAVPTIGAVVIDPGVSQTLINGSNASMSSATINGAIQMLSSVAAGGVQCTGYRFPLDARL